MIIGLASAHIFGLTPQSALSEHRPFSLGISVPLAIAIQGLLLFHFNHTRYWPPDPSDTQTSEQLIERIRRSDKPVLSEDMLLLMNRDFRFACPEWSLYTPESRRAHEILFVAQSAGSRGCHRSPQ